MKRYTTRKQEKIGAGLAVATLLALALALPGVASAAEEQVGARKAAPKASYRGYLRPVHFFVTLEAQHGGDNLDDVSVTTCIKQEDKSDRCVATNANLFAGQGYGLGLGGVFPLGSSLADIELVGGPMQGYLREPADDADGKKRDVGSSFRYFTRVQAMFHVRRGMRLGGGLITHWRTQYKVKDQGVSRRFDDAFGLRLQIDWDISGEIFSVGAYMQSMKYKEQGVENTPLDAGAVGLVVGLHFD